MKNKILIRVYAPSIDEEYEIYIPTNETINKVIELIAKSICELSDENLNLKVTHKLIEPENGSINENSSIVRDTNINNCKKTILI